MMPQYKVRVERHQRWEFEVEAASKDDAESIGDAWACREPAHEDFAYSTTAIHIEENTDD